MATKPLTIILLLCVLVLSVSADEYTVEAGEPTFITTSCIRNGEMIPDAVVHTVILDSTGSVVSNGTAVNNNDGTYRYAYTFTSEGRYVTRETCDYGDLLADGSTSIRVTSTIARNTTLGTVLSTVNGIGDDILAARTTALQINDTVNRIETRVQEFNLTNQTLNVNITDLNNSLTGLIVQETSKPPEFDALSITLIIYAIMLLVSIKVREPLYYLLVSLASFIYGAALAVTGYAALGVVIVIAGFGYLMLMKQRMG